MTATLTKEQQLLLNTVAKVIAPMETRLRALEQAQTKTLADAFQGAWLPASYKRGAVVQHASSIWLALEDTTAKAKPGEGAGWRLLVKGTRT